MLYMICAALFACIIVILSLFFYDASFLLSGGTSGQGLGIGDWGSGFGVQGSGFRVVVRRIKIWKRRRILIALRAVVISSVAERSFLQNGQYANCAISFTA